MERSRVETRKPSNNPLGKFANFFLLSFGYVGIRFLVAPVRARLLTEQLGKPLYASLSLAVTTVTLVAMFLALGSYEFLARRLPGIPPARQKGWLSLVLRRIALPGWLLAGAVASAFCLFRPAGSEFLTADNILFLWLALGLMLWLLCRVFYALGRNRIGTMRAIQLFQNDAWFLLIFAAGTWAAASFAHSLWIWTGWLATVALAVFLFDRTPGPAEAPGGKGLREVLAFGLPLMPMLVGEMLLRLADRYLLLAYCEISVVAEYILAMNIAMMAYGTGASLLDLSVPHLYAEANRNPAPTPAAGASFWGGSVAPTPEMRRIFSLALRHVTGLGAVMGLAFAFFRRDIFAVIAGPEFRNAADLMPWVAGVPLTYLVAMAAGRALLVQNRSRIVGGATLGAALLNLAVNLVVVPLWGPHGAAMSTLGSLLALAVFLFAVIDIRRWIDRGTWKPGHLLAGIAGCAAADWLIVTLLPDASHWVRLPLAAVPALLTFWLAKVFTPADMALLRAANSSNS